MTTPAQSNTIKKPFGLIWIASAWMALTASLMAGDAVLPSKTEGTIAWHDLQSLDIEGKGWADTKGFYHRLPSKAKGMGMVPGDNSCEKGVIKGVIKGVPVPKHKGL